MANEKNIRIGDVLLQAGYINQEELDEALEYQKNNKGIRLYIVTVRNHQSCRKSNQDYHADTLSLPYYMWYLGDLCNR